MVTRSSGARRLKAVRARRRLRALAAAVGGRHQLGTGGGLGDALVAEGSDGALVAGDAAEAPEEEGGALGEGGLQRPDGGEAEGGGGEVGGPGGGVLVEGGDDGGAGVEAVADGVAGGAVEPGLRAGAGGEPGVAAVGGELAVRDHGVLRGAV